MNTSQPSQHAVVIGGSVSGLLATRVLSQHFAQVTLIERDKFSTHPESRKGQPQTNHLHVLLATGKEVLESYFPGLMESLQAEGAILIDIAQSTRWHVSGDYRLQFESGIMGILMSRPFLEYQIRCRVARLPNVTVLDERTVEELIANPERTQIVGLRVKDTAKGGERVKLKANLVVDATGRSSASSRWLAALGYEKPPETLVTIELGYATRQYLRQPGELEHTKLVVVSADPPHSTRCGVIMPIEGDRWIVTLAGWGNDRPPLDEQGFVEFARSLPAPDIYSLVSRTEPVSEIFGYKYPASLRRHYEKLSKFPAGYLVMGDALCSFDPVYGQGMTSAALQAKVLEELLQTQPNIQQLALRFYKRVVKIVDIPWKLSTGEDFRFPQTQGKKPAGTDLMNAYVSLVHQATHSDQFVYGAFLRVVNLLEAPSSLLHPKIVWRVLRVNTKLLSKRKAACRPH